MFNRTIFLSRVLALGIGALLAGCSSSEPTGPGTSTAQDPVIATYRGGEVRRSDIAANLEARLARPSVTPDAASRRAIVQALAERQARIGILHQQALESRLGERPDVAARVTARKDLALAKAWLEREVLARAQVPETMIEAEFARLLPRAERAEMRAFSHIFLHAQGPEALAAARRKEVEIRRRLDAGEAFSALAREYSDSISARSGGTMSPTARELLSEDLGALVFGLAEGAVSETIENRDGLHLFRVDAIVAPVPADTAALRETVTADLRRESRNAAERDARQLAIDEVSADVAAAGRRLAAGCSREDEALITIAGQSLTCGGFATLRKRWPEVHRESQDSALAWVISNRVLAQRMLDEPGADADVEIRRLVEKAERNELVAARRDELLDAIDTTASPEEIAARHQQLASKAPELHEFVVDALFFVQTGPDAGAVQAAAQRVAKRLRDGEDFSSVLDSMGGTEGTRVLREQGGLLLSDLGRDQPPLRDELLRLAIGEVSVPLHISGNPIRARDQVLIAESGMLFVRKREERVLDLEAARATLTTLLANEKLQAGKVKIKTELDRLAETRIVLADG
jgi:parvulin-like peptidyl-prolyl isomerase